MKKTVCLALIVSSFALAWTCEAETGKYGNIVLKKGVTGDRKAES
jgi:L-fucose mutarotase/ribose pyranase (RbsD/FucU family)